MHQCVVILGTSQYANDFIGSLLALSGIPFEVHDATSGDLLHNPDTCYFCSIRRVHEKILAVLGHRPQDLRPLPEDWMSVPQVSDCVQELSSLVEQRKKQLPVFGMQDSLLCRFMPLWHKIFNACEIEPLFIVNTTDPYQRSRELEGREVLSSIHFEGGDPYVWLSDMLAAESSSRGFPRVIQVFDRAAAAPMAAIHSIARVLSLSLLEESDSKKIDPDKMPCSVLSDNSMEHRDHANPLSAMAHDLFAILKDGCRPSGLREQELSRIDVIRKGFDDLRNVFFLHGGVANHYPKQADYVLEMAANRTKMERLRENLSKVNAELEDLVLKVGMQHDMLTRLYKSNSDYKDTVIRNEAMLDSIRSSRSWRITKPLRRLTRLVRGY